MLHVAQRRRRRLDHLSGTLLFIVVLMDSAISYLDRIMGFRVVVWKGGTIEGLSQDSGLPREALHSANKGVRHAVPVSLVPGTPAEMRIRQDTYYEVLQEVLPTFVQSPHCRRALMDSLSV